jgi:hypothetical protein
MRRLVLVIVFLVAGLSERAAGAKDASARLVPLSICNAWGPIFKVSVDRRHERAIASGGCFTLLVAPGEHVVVPRAETVTQGVFREPAWIVKVPPAPSAVRFVDRSGVVDLVAEEGARSTPVGGPLPPAPGEPLFLTSMPGAVVPSWYLCWSPVSMADVLFDRTGPLFVGPSYWSTFVTTLGLPGSLGLYDLNGSPACSPFPMAMPYGHGAWVGRPWDRGGLRGERATGAGVRVLGLSSPAGRAAWSRWLVRHPGRAGGQPSRPSAPETWRRPVFRARRR